MMEVGESKLLTPELDPDFTPRVKKTHNHQKIQLFILTTTFSYHALRLGQKNMCVSGYMKFLRKIFLFFVKVLGEDGETRWPTWEIPWKSPKYA